MDYCICEHKVITNERYQPNEDEVAAPLRASHIHTRIIDAEPIASNATPEGISYIINAVWNAEHHRMKVNVE